MDKPFVCNINTLSETQRERCRDLTEKLEGSRQPVKELNDSYAYRFKADSQLIMAAAEFIAYERLCCPFFDFELAIEQNTSGLRLRLKGQDGIKE